eukprot:scaffold170276_cov36-Tisochrysis_lutea.AAC.3
MSSRNRGIPGHTLPRQKKGTARCTRMPQVKVCGGQRKVRATLLMDGSSQASRHTGGRRGGLPARRPLPPSQLGTCICPTPRCTCHARHSLCCMGGAEQPAGRPHGRLRVHCKRGQSSMRRASASEAPSSRGDK